LEAGGDNTIAALPRARPRASQRAIRLKRLRFLDFGSGKQEEAGRSRRIDNEFGHGGVPMAEFGAASPLYVLDTFSVKVYNLSGTNHENST
jgi:hypothetical protein